MNTTQTTRAAAAIFSATLTTGSALAGLVSDETLVMVDDAMPSGYFSNVATGEQALALTGVRSGNQYFSRPDDRPAVWLASWSGGMCEAVTNANSHYINGLGTCANITDSSPSYALSDFTFETFFKQANGAPGYQYYRYIFYHGGAWALRVVNNWLYLVDMASNATVSGGEISNGKWHHIAVVQNRQAGTMSLYVDYTLKGSLNYVVDAASTLGVPSFSGRANGANVVDAPQQAYYDAIRLTAKALAPEDFIMSFERAALLQGGDTLAYLSLDETVNPDYSPMPLTTKYKANPAIKGVVPGVEPLYPTASSEVSLVHTGAWHMVKSESDPNSDFKGGGFKVTDTSPSFTESSFTAELFFKPVLASSVNNSYVFAGGTTFNVWVTRAGLLYATAKGSNVNVGYTAGSVVDGAWHHVAYVWDKERGTAEIWLDHQMLGRATGLTRLAADGMEPNDTFFIGGWNEWDYGLNKAFGEVTFDEIRITKKALKATEFFTTAQLGDLSPLAWAKFSGDLSLGDDADCYVVTGKVASGSASIVTQSPGKTLTDAAGVVLDESNRQALSLDGGQVAFPANGTLDADAFTLEAFVQVRGAESVCNVVGLFERNLSNLPVCVIQTTGAGGLSARVVTTDGAATVPVTASADRAWHHVAVAVEPSGGTVAVKTYWDHALAGETSVAGVVDLSAPLGLVCGDGGFTGLLDEVRIQQGAVGPEGMLYMPPPEGFVILFR